MTTETSYLAAFLVGLFGGVHCVGMCGGIVGALSFGLPDELRQQPRRMLPYLLAYNLARITSYVLAGIMFGGISALAMQLVAINQLQQWLQVIAGVFMILLGLYVGGWWRVLLRLEQAGSMVWRQIEPLGRRFLPVHSVWHAFILGLLWGWLPCGLVYSVLIWSIASGGAVPGGLLMLSFGLGTLPNLLAMGLFAATISRWVRYPWVRWLAGGMIVGLGILELVRGMP
ncbi:MAG: sulfite exporter TauE/SafE family protein [Thiohalomonadales bacterium]|nr:sulfite exporter TauE/SafE family protein [Thiohalomonadales bacterium]